MLRLSLEAGDTRPLEPGDLDSDGVNPMSEAGCRRSRVILMVTTYWHCGSMAMSSVDTGTALQKSAALHCTLQNSALWCTLVARLCRYWQLAASIHKMKLLTHPCPGLLSDWEIKCWTHPRFPSRIYNLIVTLLM